jgi:hypothetical protein
MLGLNSFEINLRIIEFARNNVLVVYLPLLIGFTFQ